MSLSTNKGVSAQMRSQPCLNKAMQMMMLIQNKDDSPVTMSSYKFTPRAVASPNAPQRPLVRKRARSGGAEWVQVSRVEPGREAKNLVLPSPSSF